MRGVVEGFYMCVGEGGGILGAGWGEAWLGWRRWGMVRYWGGG